MEAVEIQKEFITATQAAAVLGVSLNTFHRKKTEPGFPQPVMLWSRPYYRLKEIAALGCIKSARGRKAKSP